MLHPGHLPGLRQRCCKCADVRLTQQRLDRPHLCTRKHTPQHYVTAVLLSPMLILECHWTEVVPSANTQFNAANVAPQQHMREHHNKETLVQGYYTSANP